MVAEIKCPPIKFLGWERGASDTANRRERLVRLTERGALILLGKLLNLSFSVVHPNLFHLVNKTKCGLVRSVIK